MVSLARAWVAPSVVAVLTLAPTRATPAFAQTGFEMGGRLSYGIPFGRTGTQADVTVLEDADELRDV